jgi:predicted transposase YbfD/YdcC
MEFSTLQDPEGAVSAVSSSLPARCAGGAEPVLGVDGAGGLLDDRSVQPEGLLDRLAQVNDPRDPRGVRYQLATLLAIGVCAISAAGHNTLTAIADWVRRRDPGELSRLGCPFNPLTGRYRIPDERTLRETYSRIDPAVLAAAGYGYLGALTQADPAPVTPCGTSEREQRRAWRAATLDASHQPRHAALAADGKCLRGARRPDGSQVYLLSMVRHRDAVTLATRPIPAKANEITEFAPLLGQIPDEDLADTVITADALHAQRAHAVYLVQQRHAHYLFTVKNNQPTLAAQLRRLPWKQVPILHRAINRGHGREEIREIQVLTVEGLLFPHARQVARIRRKRRRLGTRRWTTEIVYAITDLPAQQANPEDIATWARGHWTVENNAHWTRDVTFAEDADRSRTRNTPAVMAVLRDIVRGAFRLAGWANIASARRAHTTPTAAFSLYGIP